MLTPKDIETVLPQLQRFALRLTRSPDKADDLVQDSVEKMLKRSASFETGSNLAAWSATVMRNTFITQIRRSKLLQKALENGDYVPAPEAIPATQDDDLHLQRTITRALNSVANPQYREVMDRAIDGAAYREIAEEMDTPLGTVMSRLNRARATARASRL